MHDYIRNILNSAVYEAAVETPLERMGPYSERLGREVLLKREDLQPVFSFKLRGAYNRLAKLTAEERARGVICASAGNHAQGVAYSARRMGIRSVIVMPRTTPSIKVEAVRRLGGEVVIHGDTFDEPASTPWPRERRISSSAPYDDPDVIAGQGPSGSSLRQHPGRSPPSTCPLAGRAGGGIAAYVRSSGREN